jgi:hypothetical protein
LTFVHSAFGQPVLEDDVQAIASVPEELAFPREELGARKRHQTRQARYRNGWKQRCRQPCGKLVDNRLSPRTHSKKIERNEGCCIFILGNPKIYYYSRFDVENRRFLIEIGTFYLPISR